MSTITQNLTSITIDPGLRTVLIVVMVKWQLVTDILGLLLVKLLCWISSLKKIVLVRVFQKNRIHTQTHTHT